MDTIVEPCVMTFDEKDFIPRLSELPVGEHRETDVRSKLEIDITMDGKGRMLMKLKPEDEDTPMTNIDQLVQELEGKFYDVSAYDIRQILNYLHSHGVTKMTAEQRQTALEALDRLEEDAIFNQDNCFNGVNPVEDVNIIRSALRAPQVPVIEGLEEAIQYLIRLGDFHSIEAEKWRTTDLCMMYETFKEKSNMIRKCIKAAEEYSKLQNGE